MPIEIPELSREDALRITRHFGMTDWSDGLSTIRSSANLKRERYGSTLHFPGARDLVHIGAEKLEQLPENLRHKLLRAGYVYVITPDAEKLGFDFERYRIPEMAQYSDAQPYESPQPVYRMPADAFTTPKLADDLAVAASTSALLLNLGKIEAIAATPAPARSRP